MGSTILAARAVTATFARQVLTPLLFIGIGIYVLIMALIIWVAVQVSPWWLLLAIIPTIIAFAALTVWLVAWVLSRRLSPKMNKEQKTATKKVVKDIGKAAEHLGTPRFLLIFNVIKDVIVRPKNGQTFIGELAQTPGQLHRDFENLRKLF